MNISFVRNSKVLVVFIGFICGSLSALGPETVSAKSLIESCKLISGKSVPQLCGAYIQGYLDASPNIVKEDQLPSEFVTRALKTRAPQKDVAVKTVANVKFCVPSEGFLSELVTKIAEVEYDAKQHQLASSVVYSILKADYSCE